METLEPVQTLIHEIRGQRVILDSDLARIYGVAVKALNQAVKRNAARFPEDFAFRLTRDEFDSLRSQFVILNDGGSNRSQFVTGSQKHRDPRYPPYAFTEHGALMAANVLNSRQAVEMSVFVVRAFVKLRDTLATHKELAREDRQARPQGRLARQSDCRNHRGHPATDITTAKKTASDWLSSEAQ
jgi:hypothetical protein